MNAMKEYGGYIELDTYRLPMLHEGAAALNCGRNCLAYLIETKHIRKIMLPYLLCDSVIRLCEKYGLDITYYHIQPDFTPEELAPDDETWIYAVNYYGQLSDTCLAALKEKYRRLIADQAQAYFQAPVRGADTLYTCRKFFGVADGAFLYTDAPAAEYPADESFDRMRFLLGRFERSASEFYAEYAANNHMFADEPIRKMSKLTANLLHGIDYDEVKRRRTENFRVYMEELGAFNQLSLHPAEGAFAYPLLLPDGARIRKALQQQKIYIPMLWPNVTESVPPDSPEYRYAMDILPLPCDQRYQREDMMFIADRVRKLIQEVE